MEIYSNSCLITAIICTDHFITTTWGRCYDHNFLRFSPIFGKKIGVFLKNQCYDQNFAYFSFVLSQIRQFFAEFFGENI
jgi:hypothetical protein